MKHGHGDMRYFDTMEVEDKTWEQCAFSRANLPTHAEGLFLHLNRWKQTGDQYDDRVIEVVWDDVRQTWSMLRFRDDKCEGNFHTVVKAILRGIQEGVDADEVAYRASLSPALHLLTVLSCP